MEVICCFVPAMSCTRHFLLHQNSFHAQWLLRCMNDFSKRVCVCARVCVCVCPWQVANFYNTMGSQIIPSQKPMLLEPLLEFESAVQKPTPGAKGGVVTWSDPEQCQACAYSGCADCSLLAYLLF